MTQSTWSPVESSELLSLSLDFSSHILSPVESGGVWSVRWSPTRLCGGEKSIGIGQPFWDNQPFEQAVACAECCFLFIPIGYPDQMVHMSKINLHINASPARSVKEIRDKRKRVAVFLHDAV